MAESKTKPKWWWWKYIILPLVGTGGIGAIIIAMLSQSGPSNSGIQNVNNGTVIGPTFNTIGNSNTINSSTTIVTNPSDEEKLRAEMKLRIRTLLSDVNPEALIAVDSGKQMIRLFVSDLKWYRFGTLMGYSEFTNYLNVISHNQIQFGGNNNYFGEGIYDSVKSGGIWRLDLSVRPELKNK